MRDGEGARWRQVRHDRQCRDHPAGAQPRPRRGALHQPGARVVRLGHRWYAAVERPSPSRTLVVQGTRALHLRYRARRRPPCRPRHRHRSRRATRGCERRLLQSARRRCGRDGRGLLRRRRPYAQPSCSVRSYRLLWVATRAGLLPMVLRRIRRVRDLRCPLLGHALVLKRTRTACRSSRSPTSGHDASSRSPG